MSILGNPITLGGGGADLNIDFGSTPPTDTSKLWVPLSTKPSNISLQTGVDVGDFAVTKIDLVNESGATAAYPLYSGIADDGDGGWYCFGSGGGPATYGGAKASKAIWHINRSGVTKSITQQLTVGVVTPACVRYGRDIYICGGCNENTTYNNRGWPYIQKFNVDTKETTVMYNNPTGLTSTGSSEGPYGGSQVRVIGNQVVLMGGSDRVDPMMSGLIYASNVVRFINTKNGSITPYNGGTPGTRGYQNYICSYSDEVITSSYNNGDYGFTFNVKTKTGVNEHPNGANFSKNSVPMFFLGNSFTIGNNGVIYKYDPASNSFAGTGVTLPVAPNRYQLDAGYNDGKAYIAAANSIYEVMLRTPLNDNNMIISLDIQGTVWKALNTKDTQAIVYPIKVLVGDTDGWAVQKDAYLYNTTTNKWTKLDGSSTYQDMRNALNILGVT